MSTLQPHEAGAVSTDVLVIGGGPAGLTAAIYLARFHLNVVVVDRGGGRASLIPKTHNHAGFPEGITGSDLVARMRDQASRYGAQMAQAEVTELATLAGRFVASTDSNVIRARAVLLATGVSNNRPPMDDAMHDAALARGLLRYCPVCDGFEVTDRRVAVIGTGERGVKEALFLRSYTADLTLIAPAGRHELDEMQRKLLKDASVVLRDGPCADISNEGESIGITTPYGRMLFDSAYPALGSRIHSDLARQLDANMSDEGCMVVDSHQRTNVPGLYAAGDVVLGLDQISHAMGEGGVAATTIRNDLSKAEPLLRSQGGDAPQSP
jgi:thioredoxin reductase (NADPH)